MKLGSKNNHEFYIDAVLEYGACAQGVHWHSKESQYKRFDVLISFIKKDISTSSIVDAGCGFAELNNYLKIKNLQPLQYTGYEIESIMIEKTTRFNPKINIKQKDILIDELQNADYYICSGAMNILTKDEMFLFIDRCFEASKKGFAFNFLVEGSFNNVTLSDVLTHCKKLSNKIRISNNYLPNDISIYLNKHYLTN